MSKCTSCNISKTMNTRGKKNLYKAIKQWIFYTDGNSKDCV